MLLRDWRIRENRTQAECAAALGLAGGARSFQRTETGENLPDADMVERIRLLTAGEVSAADLHITRLSWLRENRPEKFEPTPAAAPEAA